VSIASAKNPVSRIHAVSAPEIGTKRKYEIEIGI